MSPFPARVIDGFGVLAFYTLRALEGQLSPSALYLLLRPFAYIYSSFGRKASLPEFFLRPPAPRAVREARITYHLSRILEFFPDRLATAKWQARFATDGLGHIQKALENGKGVVLVCFHFGTYKLMPFWLRASGIPVIALLGGNSKERTRAKQMKDQLSPCGGMPTVLYKTDQMRKVVEHLSAGRVLFVATDREAHKQILVPIDDQWSLRIATGAIRLASRCEAELIPCCMTDEGGWNFRLTIAPPVPREYLAQESTMIRAAEHLLHEMLPPVRTRPEQSSSYLIDSFRRTTPDRSRESSLV